MSIEQITNSLEHIEKQILNYGVIPGISIVCGVVRAIIGIAQVVFGGLGFLLTVVTEDKKDKYYAEQHFMHGWLNLIRASMEIIPGLNFILIPYDLKNGGFRFNYTLYKDPTNPKQLAQKTSETNKPPTNTETVEGAK